MHIRWSGDQIEVSEIPQIRGALTSSDRLKDFLFASIEMSSCTLRDLYRVIDQDPGFWSTALMNTFLFESVDEFHNLERNRGDLDRLLVKWQLEIQQGELFWSSEFWGEKDSSQDRFGLSLTPLDQIIDCPMLIDPSVDLIEGQNDRELGDRWPTVSELFYTVLFELTWHGGPKGREETTIELKRRAKDLEDGKVKSFPADEFFDRIKRRCSGQEPDEDHT